MLNSGVLDATGPQIVIYEQLPTGRLQLIGADFVILAEQWIAERQRREMEKLGKMAANNNRAATAANVNATYGDNGDSGPDEEENCSIMK